MFSGRRSRAAPVLNDPRALAQCDLGFGPPLTGSAISAPSHDEVLNTSKVLNDARAIIRPYVYTERKIGSCGLVSGRGNTGGRLP
jgi:hypothetical protein